MADLEGDDNNNSFEVTEEIDILFGHGAGDSILEADSLDALFAHDFSAPEGDTVRVALDDFTNAEVVALDDYGPVLLMHGENTDTYLLSGSEEPLDMLDDILFI